MQRCREARPEFDRPSSPESMSGLQRVGGAGILAVVALADGRLVVPAESQVQGQPRGDAPVILHKDACIGLLERRSDIAAHPSARGPAEQERRERIAGGGAARLPVLLREARAEAERVRFC